MNFRDVTDGSVGNCYSGGTVSIEIDKDAKPISCKPHRIPESIKCKVKTLWTNS